jgi:hypothetical protein
MPIIRRKLLSIAFSGKRNHPKLGLISAPLRELFDGFEIAYPGIALQLVSGLADGADQLASTIFIDGGHSEQSATSTRLLGAIIPFRIDEYRSTIQDNDSFDALYDKCSYRVQLDGSFVRNEDGSANYREAYRQQARILPRVCDIFLAVAEMAEDGSKGGTKEAILAALITNKPVVLLNLENLQFYFYSNMEEWVYASKPPVAPREIARLSALLYRKATYSSKEYHKKDALFYLRRWTWKLYERLFEKKKHPTREKTSKNEIENAFFDKIHENRSTVSELSKYFMFQYRGGYLLNYFLAIAAIFIAVNTSTIHMIQPQVGKVEHPLTKTTLLLLGILKVAVILLIIRNTKKINRQQYNAKAIKFRYASERLRVVSYFSLFGIPRIPFPFVGTHLTDHLREYPGEAIYRRIVSQQIIQLNLTVQIDKNYILRVARFIKAHWLEGQVAYYRGDYGKMTVMDKRLMSIPEKLSTIVMVIVIAEIVEILLPPPIHNLIADLIQWLVPALIGISILLPGVITTLNSVHFQSEAKRLAFRNEIMIEQLTNVIAEFDKEIRRVEAKEEGNNLITILALMDKAANIASDEVAEWTMIYEKPVFDQ